MQDLPEALQRDIKYFGNQCSEMVLKLAGQVDLTRYSPDKPDIIYRDGFEALEKGEANIAAANFALLVFLEPEQPQLFFALACALKELGEWQQALAFFQAAQSPEMSNPFVFFHIGECLYQLGEVNAARDALSVTIEMCYAMPNVAPHFEIDQLCQYAQGRLAEING